MTTLHPWINFNGNAFDAFTFYKSIFGGEFTEIIRMKDLASAASPAADSGAENSAQSDAEKIMRIGLPIGPHTILYANDVPSFLGAVNEHENRSKILVSADTKEKADALFAGLSAGGDIEAPMGASPWGTYFGMCRDKYGIEWMVEVSDK